MKQDCGKNELKIIAWDIIYNLNSSDKEIKIKNLTKVDALIKFNDLIMILKNPHSSVRLYIRDKKGFMNCIKSWSFSYGITTNRINEL